MHRHSVLKSFEGQPPLLLEMNGVMGNHENNLVSFITDVMEFKQAVGALREASTRLAKRYTEYGKFFTDKSDPDVEASARCCQRATAFFEDFAQSLSTCGASVGNVVVEDLKKCVDEISTTRDKGKVYAVAYSAAESAKKRVDTISRKNSTAGHSSQRDADSSRKSCDLAERDVMHYYGVAVHDVNLVTMRSFVSFYDILDAVFNSGSSLTGDFKNDRDRFLDVCTESSRAMSSVGQASEGRSDTDTDTDDLDDSIEEALTGNALDCYRAISDNCKKYASLLAAYQDILSKMQVDLTGSKISPNDVARLAKATQEVQMEFAAIGDKLKNEPPSESVIAVITEIIGELKQRLEDPYKHYFESSPYVQYIFEKHQKNKVIRAGQKQYDQRCVQTGLSREKWLDSVVMPVRFPDALLSEVRSLSSRVPSENPAWDPLQNACERLNAFCDFAKDAKKRSANMLALLKLRDSLPEEKNLVSIARVFCAEGKVTCNSLSAAPSNSPSPPPLPGHPPALPGALSPPLHGLSGSLSSAATAAMASAGEDGNNLVAGHTYYTFLFNDMILFCVPKKKGSIEKGYIAAKRFNTRSLTFEPGNADEHTFQLTHSGRTMHFSVSAEDYNLWIGELKKAITERNQNVVFGVALSKLMERSPDKIVPSVFSDAAEYIRENGKDAEGIFRLSVTSNVLLEFQETIDSGKSVMYTDVYVAANIIKSWLRALPEPLLTFGMYDQWIAAQDDPKALYSLVQKLPKDNSFMLSALIRLLKDLSVYSEVTRMTSNNLAIVIAPNILYRRGDEMNISQGPTNVVDTLIISYEEIFRDVIKKEADNATFVNEVARSRRNTLRKRASKLANTVGNGGTMPTLGTSPDQKKTHHQTSTQASLMSIFARGDDGGAIPPPAGIPPPSVKVRSKSSAATLSSSVVSATVSELMQYTDQSPASSIESPSKIPSLSGVSLEGSSTSQFGVDPQTLLSLEIPTDGGNAPLPAEFDVSDINFGSGPGTPGTPMANPDILPPPILPDIQPPPLPASPNDIPPPPLPDDIPPPPLP